MSKDNSLDYLDYIKQLLLDVVQDESEICNILLSFDIIKKELEICQLLKKVALDDYTYFKISDNNSLCIDGTISINDKDLLLATTLEKERND